MKLILLLLLCAAAWSEENFEFGDSKMIEMPNHSFSILNTEVTQKLYTKIMGENPSYYKSPNNPVERVTWCDAVYFCNKLSERCGLTPVYALDGDTDITHWNFKIHDVYTFHGVLTQDTRANGFRLPTNDEWTYAAKGGEDFVYAGSNNIDEVAWHEKNSKKEPHPVAQKKPNAYGLYDMCGNIMEWVWIDEDDYIKFYRGGSYYLGDCKITAGDYDGANDSGSNLGFRIARTIK